MGKKGASRNFLNYSGRDRTKYSKISLQRYGVGQKPNQLRERPSGLIRLTLKNKK